MATYSAFLAIPSFIALVEHLKNKLQKPTEQDDIRFLRGLFVGDEYQWAIRVRPNLMSQFGFIVQCYAYHCLCLVKSIIFLLIG